MGELIRIGNADISIKEYKGQRVVTFKDIDMVHNRPDGTARKTFWRNKDHFIKGEDYFVLETDEARKTFNIEAPNGLALITEQGYTMLIKSFTDDSDWKVQRQLVNGYFRVRQLVDERLSPQLRATSERKPIEWKGKVVITTALLAEAYETSVDNVKMNFNRHKDNFIEGTHYFLLQGEDLREFKNLVTDSYLVDKRTPQLYLWTERGANRHCKILDTDKAWEQFGNLEETYFKVKEIVNTELSPELQILQGLLDQMKQKELADRERDRQISKAKETADKAVETAERIKEAIQPVFGNWREETNKKFNRIQKNADVPFDMLRIETYSELERRAGCDLTTRLRNKKQRMADSGCTKKEINDYNRMDIISEDKKLREIFSKIVSEYEIRYCA